MSSLSEDAEPKRPEILMADVRKIAICFDAQFSKLFEVAGTVLTANSEISSAKVHIR